MTGLVMGLDIVVCGAVHMHQTKDIDMYQVIWKEYTQSAHYHSDAEKWALRPMKIGFMC